VLDIGALRTLGVDRELDVEPLLWVGFDAREVQRVGLRGVETRL
jgi:hypothetical protein